MYKYTRKYYIHNQEVSFETIMKYIEIMLTHSEKDINKIGVRFEDIKTDL